MPPIRRMRRRPVAKAAVVGGAAYAGKKHGERKGQEEAEAQQAVEEGAPAGAAKEDDTLEQLKKLGELRDSGVLTDEEFEAEKRKLLAG